ncbi:hypothetical protein COO60DRAFT_79757 [Scenedesmus sp. NREL 46B-D3]|nr:hypothetical protein COO60DRAFT_79757 [Scenedesmus sp. NREL 46B-D3]
MDGCNSIEQCSGTCNSSPSPCSSFATCSVITGTQDAGFRCTCNACYTGTGTSAAGGGCFAPDFQGFIAVGKAIVSPPAVNTVKAGNPINFRFSLGCDTGPSIFAPGFPRLTGGVSCESFAVPNEDDEPSPLLKVQPLPQGPGLGAWTYDANTMSYSFNFKTLKAWAGMCAVLELEFDQDRRAAHGTGGGRAWFRLK